jgi:hypothetical protein
VRVCVRVRVRVCVCVCVPVTYSFTHAWLCVVGTHTTLTPVTHSCPPPTPSRAFACASHRPSIHQVLLDDASSLQSYIEEELNIQMFTITQDEAKYNIEVSQVTRLFLGAILCSHSLLLLSRLCSHSPLPVGSMFLESPNPLSVHLLDTLGHL